MTLQTLPATSRWNLFKIEGQLDFATAPTVQAALAHAAGFDHSDLLIDLEDVTSIDEAGVTRLTGAVQRLIAERPSLQVAFVTTDTRLADVLGDAKLSGSVLIFRSGAEALRAIGLSEAA